MRHGDPVLPETIRIKPLKQIILKKIIVHGLRDPDRPVLFHRHIKISLRPKRFQLQQLSFGRNLPVEQLRHVDSRASPECFPAGMLSGTDI